MRRLIVLGLVVLVAGCATSRGTRSPLPASTQQELLQHLEGFRFNGRASVRGGSADFVAPSLVWQQKDATSQVRLSGPLGGGSLQLEYSPASLRVTTSRGDEAHGDDAAQFIAAQLGFMPPFEALRYWVLGLAAPGSPTDDLSLDSTGRIARLVQLGWRIEFVRWAHVALRPGDVLVPQKLVATNGELKLTVIVDRWKLGAGT